MDTTMNSNQQGRRTRLTRTIEREQYEHSYMRPTVGFQMKEIDKNLLQNMSSLQLRPDNQVEGEEGRKAYLCDVTMGDFQL